MRKLNTSGRTYLVMGALSLFGTGIASIEGTSTILIFVYALGVSIVGLLMFGYDTKP